MKNSNDMCHPLCLPFECCEMDSRTFSFTEKEFAHYYAELLFVREGKIRVSLEQELISVSSGEAVMICPGVQHKVVAEGNDSFRFDLIRMDPDRMPDLPDYTPELKVVLSDARRDNLPMLIPAPEAKEMVLPELCAMCVREAANHDIGFDLCVTSLLSLICVAVIRFWQSRGMKLSAREVQTDPIYSLSGYIQRHLRDDLRVEDLANRCGLSYPWFAKKFRMVYGVSCKDYIEQIRVKQVEKYLMFTDLDLTRISEITGYADCSHMIKNFKRIMNITPGQYRLKRR